jgi:hypothetical protein
MHFDALHRTSLFIVAFIGYCVGGQITLMAVFIMHRAEPALHWIVPAILVPTLVASAAQGLLGKLWRTRAVDLASHARSGEDDLVIKTLLGDNDGMEKNPQRGMAKNMRTVTRDKGRCHEKVPNDEIHGPFLRPKRHISVGTTDQ